MPRTITVKGVGNVSAEPDYVVIDFKFNSLKKDYQEALDLATKKIDQLNETLESIGFNKKSVKTTRFDVDTEYESVKNKNGDYNRVFKGYNCEHHLKVEFDLDAKRLAKTLEAISKCAANPEISISFTVKNPDALKEKLLKSATKNAKDNALILCTESKVKLGLLLSVEYNWGEIKFLSATHLSDGCASDFSRMDINPENINVSDSATFVWEIK